ncbi:MAG: hypothetical protein ACRYG7_19645 [Janthinobacterium lividum]
MLSLAEFEALLQRYAAGTSPAAEQHLVDRWLARPAEPPLPELTAEELAQARAAIWQRIATAVSSSTPQAIKEA